jgi:uncharacterized membrane protein YgcG
MNVQQRYARIVTTVLFAVLLTMAWTATDLHAAVIGSLRNVTGPVDIMRGGALPAVVAKNGDPVSSGDMIRTKTGGFVEVVYKEGTVLRISERSRVDIGEHFSEKSPNSSEVRLTRGKVRAIVDLKNIQTSGTGPKKFEVRTPNAIAGVRGTDWGVMHQQNTTTVMTFTGTVYTFNPLNPASIATLTAGTVSTVTGPAPPLPPRPATLQELQQMQRGTAPPSPGGGSGGGASGGNGNRGGGSSSGGSGGGGGSGAGSAGTQGAAATGPGAGTGTGGGTSSGGGSSVFTSGMTLPSMPVIEAPGTQSGVITPVTIATGGATQVIVDTTGKSSGTHTDGAVTTTAGVVSAVSSSGGATPPIVAAGTPTATTPGHSTAITTPTTPPPPPPTPTTTNVNVGINFKGLPAKK